MKRLAAALLGVPVVGGRGWPVDQEGGTLCLPHGVKATDSDVGIGEGLGGVLDLGQDLAGVRASEHGQLVHGPVPGRVKPSVSLATSLHCVRVIARLFHCNA